MASAKLARKIAFNVPCIGAEEIGSVVETLRSGWLTTGSKAAQLEKEVAAFTRARYAVAVNSCTAGLHLSLLALGVGPGDEVITTPYTFPQLVRPLSIRGRDPCWWMLNGGDSTSIPKRSPRRSRPEPRLSCPSTSPVIPAI